MTTQSSFSRLFSRLVPLAMLLAAANLYAESPISISLSGAAEVPPVTTSATGKVNISVLPNRSVSGSIDISDMVPTMAHIHEGAVGKNGPPIVTLIKKGDKVFTVPADARLSEAQYTAYLAGNLYVNVHSEAHPNGEIRAQLPGKPIRIAN
ncbi:MAG: CHRD domain-containing protein [Dechloromonas sp.]|uniref:CHRD domain-containing protein n=1 Tax=Dechloromonas sp. TaxID=1917218 RepID=UPI0027F05558|nr:CHRD domain-containing protein [Dechloromonas sp.]MBT9519252.1 CHRD domain-containing protein [Dechloromonas sp.]